MVLDEVICGCFLTERRAVKPMLPSTSIRNDELGGTMINVWGINGIGSRLPNTARPVPTTL